MAKQKNTEEIMSRMRVPKAVAVMAIPSVVSSLVTVIYNLADTFFVGQTGDPLQVAAVSLTNPIFILLMAFANILGVGGCAAASIALGKEDYKKAKNVSAFMAYGSLIVGVIIMVILFTCMGPVLNLLGANEETCAFAKGYTTYIAIGAPFVIFSAASSFVIRAEGFSKEAMIGNMIGTFTNIILDPIFISVLGQGAAGAAIATTLGNILASAYYIVFFLKKSKLLSLHPKYFRCSPKIWSNVIGLGLPMGIQSALMTVSTIVINQMLVAYGNNPVAAMGIVFKAYLFIAFTQMGLANGVQPLMGYNYGCGNMKRFKSVEQFSKLCCFIVGCAATALYVIFRAQIIGVFIDDSEVISYGVRMLMANLIAGPFLGIMFMNMNCMQSVNHATPPTILSILRQGGVLIPMLFVLRAVFGMNGIILSQGITDILMTVLSVIMWIRVKNKYLPKI